LVKYTNAEGIEHHVEFFQSVYGLLPDEVLNASVPVNIRGTSEREVTFRILHPLHCLESRAHNVMDLAFKYSNPHGLRQMKASIVCLREFILELAQHRPQESIGLNQKVFELACHDLVAQRLFALHKIDVFDAIACAPPVPESFRLTEYPKMREALRALRHVSDELRRH
jgi:hypothetical protein